MQEFFFLALHNAFRQQVSGGLTDNIFLFLSEPGLFVGWTAFNLYSVVVIAIPFRRLEKWAWYATWILPVGMAAAAFTDRDISLYFYAMSAVCVLGLRLSMRDFFSVERQIQHRVPW